MTTDSNTTYPEETTSVGMRHEDPKTMKIFRWVVALFFAFAGLNHFVSPEWYLANQMPSWIPFPLFALYASGVAEIAGGIGLLIERVRRWAGFGLVLLLIAVFPGNVHMAARSIQESGWGAETVGLLLRLPLQSIFIVGVLWVSRRDMSRSS